MTTANASPDRLEPRCASRTAPRFHLDVAPLQEVEYTGIPHVAAKLCEQLLGDAEVEPAFFYNRHELPVWLVEHALKARTGSVLRWAAGRRRFEPLLSRLSAGQPVWGLHCNAKYARRMFPVEGQLVHDMTTLVTPEHHDPAVNSYHQGKIYGDLMSNDVTVCVSHSTVADLVAFYPQVVAQSPPVVAHLGVDWSHIPASVRAETVHAEPYVFVLGTLEPRKNVGVLLELLERDPSIADQMRFVFGGRVGWGDAFETQLVQRGLAHLAARGRLLQTGFITEAVKYRLLKHARAVVYPSVYEGFGLPVAEAVSLGVPVVTTPSSSLPEVGRAFAFYFDPDDLGSLTAALKSALGSGRVEQGRDGETLGAWAKRFSWARCYRTIRDALAAANPQPAR